MEVWKVKEQVKYKYLSVLVRVDVLRYSTPLLLLQQPESATRRCTFTTLLCERNVTVTCFITFVKSFILKKCSQFKLIFHRFSLMKRMKNWTEWEYEFGSPRLEIASVTQHCIDNLFIPNAAWPWARIKDVSSASLSHCITATQLNHRDFWQIVVWTEFVGVWQLLMQLSEQTWGQKYLRDHQSVSLSVCLSAVGWCWLCLSAVGHIGFSQTVLILTKL